MDREPDQSPKKLSYYLLWSVGISVALMAVGLAVCGLTGALQTEYKATPIEEAILLVLGGTCYAIVPGLLVGVIFWSRARWKHDRSAWCSRFDVVWRQLRARWNRDRSA